MTFALLRQFLASTVAGTAFFAFSWIMVAPDSSSPHAWVTDGVLTLLSVVFGIAYKEFRGAMKKLGEVHQVSLLIRMEHEQLMTDFLERKPGAVRASETFAQAMAMGKAAGAD